MVNAFNSYKSMVIKTNRWDINQFTSVTMLGTRNNYLKKILIDFYSNGTRGLCFGSCSLNTYTSHHIFYTFLVKTILNSVLAICCTYSSSFLMSSAYFCVVCLKNSFKWSTSSSATASFLPRSSSDGCLLGVLFTDSYWTTRTCINMWSSDQIVN